MVSLGADRRGRRADLKVCGVAGAAIAKAECRGVHVAGGAG